MVVAMGTLVSRNYEKEGQRRSYTELRAQHIAVDLASVETVRNYNGSRTEGSEAPQGEAGESASEHSAEDPVGAPGASTSAAAEQTQTSPMKSDAAPATPAALSPEAQDSGASDRPQYAAASTGGDPMDSGETPF
jgi:single-stranded DNA-binding protein